MSAKTVQKTPQVKKAVTPVVRAPKSREQITKELREQRALDPGKSAVEDYLTPNSRHFGF